jgi:hypothetical protein
MHAALLETLLSNELTTTRTVAALELRIAPCQRR